jgi:hypothetical protein
LSFQHNCKLALNILRVLSRLSWGKDRMMILQLDCHLIRPKIGNGSFLYDPASKSKLSIWDTSCNWCLPQQLSYASKCLHKAAAMESKETPPSLQGSFLRCRYTVKRTAHPHRLSYSAVFCPTLHYRYEINIIAPWLMKVHFQHLGNLHMNLLDAVHSTETSYSVYM